MACACAATARARVTDETRRTELDRALIVGQRMPAVAGRPQIPAAALVQRSDLFAVITTGVQHRRDQRGSTPMFAAEVRRSRCAHGHLVAAQTGDRLGIDRLLPQFEDVVVVRQGRRESAARLRRVRRVERRCQRGVPLAGAAPVVGALARRACPQERCVGQLVQSARQRLVHARPLTRQHVVVHRFAQERVPEAVRAVGPVGDDHTARDGLADRGQPRRVADRRRGSELRVGYRPAGRCEYLQHLPSDGRDPIGAREQRLAQRLRHRLAEPCCPGEFLGDVGVAARPVEDRGDHVVGDLVAEDGGDELPRGGQVERLEIDAHHRPGARELGEELSEPRAHSWLVGTHRAQYEHVTHRQHRQAQEHVERRLVGPVQIFDDEQDRLRRAELMQVLDEQTLGDVSRAQVEATRDHRAPPRPLDEAGELGGQAALADPGLAGDEQQTRAGAGRAGTIGDDGGELAQFGAASNQRPLRRGRFCWFGPARTHRWGGSHRPRLAAHPGPGDAVRATRWRASSPERPWRQTRTSKEPIVEPVATMRDEYRHEPARVTLAIGVLKALGVCRYRVDE